MTFSPGTRLGPYEITAKQGRLAVLDLATWQAAPVPGSPELAGRATASRDLRTLASLEDDSQADIWLAEEATTP